MRYVAPLMWLYPITMDIVLALLTWTASMLQVLKGLTYELPSPKGDEVRVRFRLSPQSTSPHLYTKYSTIAVS